MIDRVTALMREVASEAVLPRFRRLAADDIQQKSPGEEVTIADEEAERLLSGALPSIVPGSLVIGEEAVAGQPDLLDRLGSGSVWLVDSLDGTANFIEGSPCFSMMVTLLRDGRAVASWMLSPATDVVHVAEQGSGATINGEPVRCRPAPAWSDLRGSILTRFLPPQLRERILNEATGCRDVLPGLRCAGEEYPAIVQGTQDFAVFWRTLPWDHVPGILFLEEAGGRAARFDGTSYSAAKQGSGLLAACTPELWTELQWALRLSQPSR